MVNNTHSYWGFGQRYGNWVCFRPQVRGVVQWLSLALSKGPNRVGVFPPSPDD
jgi:hypothetical protein